MYWCSLLFIGVYCFSVGLIDLYRFHRLWKCSKALFVLKYGSSLIYIGVQWMDLDLYGFVLVSIGLNWSDTCSLICIAFHGVRFFFIDGNWIVWVFIDSWLVFIFCIRCYGVHWWLPFNVLMAVDVHWFSLFRNGLDGLYCFALVVIDVHCFLLGFIRQL